MFHTEGLEPLTHEEMVQLYERGRLAPCDFCENCTEDCDCDFYDEFTPNHLYREATGQ